MLKNVCIIKPGYDGYDESQQMMEYKISELMNYSFEVPVIYYTLLNHRVDLFCKLLTCIVWSYLIHEISYLV